MRKRTRIILFGIGLAILFMNTPAFSEVLLDVNPTEVTKAYLFRDHADTGAYYYIPKSPRVAAWADGTPKFSFIKYIKTNKNVTGGIVHFLVTLGLTQDEIVEAEKELHRVDKEGKVLGPVPFIKGEFHIISASAGSGGIFSRKIVGTGKAPLLAGQEAAVSIALSEEGATFLEKSFMSPTSDVSVQFLLTFRGLTPAYKARLKVDWDKVYKHKELHLKASSIFLSAKISKVYGELRESGAIALEVTGEDENMDALLQTAYATLTQMMFEAKPVEQGDLGKERSSAGGTWFAKLFGGANFGYYMKKTRYAGTYVVDLTRRKRDEREIPITGNVGDIYKRFGGNKKIFQTVDLDDPAFETNTVHVILDGEDYDTFKEYVNFVTVTYEKAYKDKSIQPKSGHVIFDQATFQNKGNRQSFAYPRLGEKGPGWLKYRYRQTWSIRGGLEKKVEFAETDAPVLTLSPPYRYRVIEVLADEENMIENEIFRIAVQFRHKYLDKTKQHEVVLRKGESLNAFYRYPAVPDALDYEYRFIFLLRTGAKVETDWKKGVDPFVYAYFGS